MRSKRMRSQSVCQWILFFFLICTTILVFQSISYTTLTEYEKKASFTSNFHKHFKQVSNIPLTENIWEHAFDPIHEKIMRKEDILSHLNINSIDSNQIIYFVTPTYHRITQYLDLIRLSQTLRNDPLIYWIVIEDSRNCTKRIRDILDRSGLMYSHVAVPTPTEIKTMKIGPKGVAQRNRGLDIVESIQLDGILYFGDDDNAYDIRLFDELRKTKYVSVFSVGFVGGGAYERCIVDRTTGKVWYLSTNWPGGRIFPMDMGGFAFHTRALNTKKPRFRNDWQMGFLETKFVEQMLQKPSQLEPLLSNCTKIYVWHVKTSGGTMNRVYSDKSFHTIKNLV